MDTITLREPFDEHINLHFLHYNPTAYTGLDRALQEARVGQYWLRVLEGAGGTNLILRIGTFYHLAAHI